ncbi:MAG TPA: folylpolyglutamate synthase/dihydrofolate synthase family protein [Pseudobacteroides sp.]|uniref:bifunctional folylpolyglutamate synthase/dihydrofolate synthase n=1 Tax=Pseudobacteroides sp. TaxID=1968840 RepID=UPI002F9545BA
MNYTEALEYIHGTLKFGIKLGLENIKALLLLMGNPHKSLKFVHVAGTNGKGSTVAFISSILMESGYKTGIFTSPYLERFTERIKVDRGEIAEADVARITAFVKQKADELVKNGGNHPTEFEIVTAIAFQYFYETGCDIVVLEVGLGGRFDSTNVIDMPLAAVITTISYDHMNILGDTLEKIAFEKAGIIKDNSDVVLYPQAGEALEVFERVCEEKKSRLNKVSLADVEVLESGIWGSSFLHKRHGKFKISIAGEHQVANAVTALEAVEIVREKGYDRINKTDVESGLIKAVWPGRLEVVCKEPMFIIDGAHNKEGALMLADNLKKYFPGKDIIFIIGVLKDKDYKAIIEPVIPIASEFVTVKPENERGMTAQELAVILRGYCKDVNVSDKIEEAILYSIKKVSTKGIICAYGSLYYIGEIRKFFNTLK